MKTLNTEALNQAKQVIKQQFGDLFDLPEDVRNTIANTYYEFCLISTEHNKFSNPQSIALANSFEEGLKKYSSDIAHIKSAAKFMPEIIAEIREIRKKGEQNNYKFLLQVFQDNFKYRIPNALNKSSLRLSLERPFYVGKAKEIQNLWKLV
jgi:hypothetical protein